MHPFKSKGPAPCLPAADPNDLRSLRSPTERALLTTIRRLLQDVQPAAQAISAAHFVAVGDVAASILGRIPLWA
jgi:hypothetical protein